MLVLVLFLELVRLCLLPRRFYLVSQVLNLPWCLVSLIICRAFATARALELCERPDPNGANEVPPQKLGFG